MTLSPAIALTREPPLGLSGFTPLPWVSEVIVVTSRAFFWFPFLYGRDPRPPLSGSLKVLTAAHHKGFSVQPHPLVSIPFLYSQFIMEATYIEGLRDIVLLRLGSGVFSLSNYLRYPSRVFCLLCRIKDFLLGSFIRRTYIASWVREAPGGPHKGPLGFHFEPLRGCSTAFFFLALSVEVVKLKGWMVC